MRAIAADYEGIQWVKVVTRVYDWRLRCQVLQPEWKWRAVRGPKADPDALLGFASEPDTEGRKIAPAHRRTVTTALIQRALGDGPRTAVEVAHATGFDISTVNEVLRTGPFIKAGRRLRPPDAAGRVFSAQAWANEDEGEGELEG